MTYLRAHKIEILLFLVLLACYSYFFHLSALWNVNSRLDLVRAVVDKRTLRIDAYHENTEDKSFYKGHYYSDKAIGTAFFGIPVYFVLKIIYRWLGLPLTEFTIRYPVRVATVSLMAALFGVVFYDFLGYFSKTKNRLWLTFAYALGTLAFPYATLFYGHQLGAVLSFSAFYVLFQMKKRKVSNVGLLIGGLLTGLAFMVEFPLAVVSLLLFIYLYTFVKEKQKIWLFILPVSLIVLIMLGYNYLCFGHPLSMGYFHHANPVFQKGAQGFVGFGCPNLYLLFMVTFSPYRGLFFGSPFLLLALPGLYLLFKQREFRAEFYLSLIVVFFFFLMNSSHYVWWGGWALGARHLIPALPFLVWPIIFVLEKNRFSYKLLTGFLVATSILFMFVGTAVDPQVPETIRNPLFQFSFPKFIRGEIAFNLGRFLNLSGLASLFPLLLVVAFGLMLLVIFQTEKQRESVN